MSVVKKQRRASAGVFTIGSPRTLKLVLSTRDASFAADACDQLVIAHFDPYSQFAHEPPIDMRHAR